MKKGPMFRPDQSALTRWSKPLGIILLILFAFYYPKKVDEQHIWNLFFLICLHISSSQSWNILAGFAGQTNLGHSAFFGLGALVTRILWLSEMPFAYAFLLGGIASFGFAMLIGAPTFRLRGAYFAIGTLGVSEILRITVSQNLPLISSLPAKMIGTYDLPIRFYLSLSLAITTTFVAWLLLRSSWSLGILAVREDEEAAQATGVHILRHKLLALAFSSFFAGLAGGVFSYHQISYYHSSAFSPIWTFDATLITFIGGLGNIVGPVIGAVFFVLAQDQLGANPGLLDTHQIIFGLIFIITVLIFPGGLIEIWNRLSKFIFSLRKSKFA